MLLVRNTILNLSGNIIPVIISIVTIPLIIKGFGVERFGILLIAWALVGYLGLFDFGLGRATIRFMAKAWSDNNGRQAASYFWISFSLNLLLGVVGGLLLAIIYPWLVGSFLKVPPFLKEETLHTFFWLSFSIPLMTGGASLIGALEARQRFGLINMVQISADSIMKIAPLIILPFSQKVDSVIFVTLILRFMSFLVYMVLCLKSIPELRMYGVFQHNLYRPLLSFGGWLSITNVIGPLMSYMDRFVIGNFLSMSAVTYYSTPCDLVRKLQILPMSLSRTLFPIFGAVDQLRTKGNSIRLYEQSMRYLIMFMIPVVVFIIILAGDLLEFWLGHEFVSHSTMVLQILTVGAFINALAKPPYALIQGFGRPDLTAKFHMLELGFFVPMLIGFVQWFGIIGAATVWTLRVFADTLLLQIYASKLLQNSAGTANKNNLFTAELSSFFVIGLAYYFSGIDILRWKLLSIIFLIITFGLWFWYKLLSNDERLRLRNYIFHFSLKPFARIED